MENRNILKQLIPLTIIILGAALMRIVPNIPNVTAITALALFSGATLRGWKSFTVPLTAMFLSDMVIGFHSTMLFVYGSFIVITFLGHVLHKYTAFKLLAITTISSVLFFLITNFGVWLTSEMYSKDSIGLIQAYVMGLPFLRNTFIGDVLYTFSLFYGYSFFGRFITFKYVNKSIEKKV